MTTIVKLWYGKIVHKKISLIEHNEETRQQVKHGVPLILK